MTPEQPQEWAGFQSRGWAENERAIGARVRAVREEQGWTGAALQSRLDEAGLVVRLEDVEAGVTSLTVTTLHVLCLLLELRAHDFWPRRTWEPAPEVVEARGSVAKPFVLVQEWARANPQPGAVASSRIRTEAMNDGGWYVSIDTTGTAVADRQLAAIEHEPSTTEWMTAWAERSCYTAMVWPGGLHDAFAVFCRWVGDEHSKG